MRADPLQHCGDIGGAPVTRLHRGFRLSGEERPIVRLMHGDVQRRQLVVQRLTFRRIGHQRFAHAVVRSAASKALRIRCLRTAA
jgi:hypothetical protein